MKANELTDGIYVYFNCFDGSKIIVKVTGFNDGIVYGVSKYGAHWCQISKIEPILLTPEILEKNGFENDFYEEEESVADYHKIRLQGYSLKNNIDGIDAYLITWCNGSLNVTTGFHGCVQKEIAYVHDLQHALRLCGIEKTIEL